MLRKLLVFLLSFGLLLPLFQTSAFAQEKTEKKEVTVVLPLNATVNHDYFAAGTTVDVEGTVNGDVYIAGGTILINGTVNGDVLAGGGQVTIKGNVRNIRVAGGQVLIEGKVSGNVTALGGTVIIGTAAQITGSLVGAGGQYTVLAPIGKTLTVAGGQVTVSSVVGGDATVFAGGQLTLTPTAKVNGNIWYQSGMPAQIESGAVVTGKLTHVLPPEPKKEVKKEPAPVPFGTVAGFSLIGGLYALVFGFLVGLMFLGLVPVYTHRGVSIIARKPWLALGVGLVGWLLTPLAVVLLALSVIGLPFLIPLIFLVIVFTYLGKIFFAVFLGNWIETKLKWKTHRFVSFLVGLVVFEVLGIIPIVGWIFACLATATGFGSIILLKKEYYHQLRGKSMI